jgi:hypothetical protein
MVISCLYMCICSKFVFIGDDGHMRIFCCGKAVTGSTPSPPPPVHCLYFPVDYALIKKRIIFSSMYKEIQNGAVAKSYMTNGLLINGELFVHCLIY